jgi:hypothetical protein
MKQIIDGVPIVDANYLLGTDISGLTSGGVWFSNSTGAPTVDATNLFWDYTNGRLGLGTGTPTSRLSLKPQVVGEDSNTVLLIHADGADGSTTFTDTSSSAHPITANGNAQVDTSSKKFGTGSALFDGTGDFLLVSDHADFDLTNNFTIDLWFKRNVTGIFQTIISKEDSITTKSGYVLFFHSNNTIRFQGGDGTTWASLNVITSGTYTDTSQWHHLVAVFDNGTGKIFVDGVQDGSDTSTALATNNLDLAIGEDISAVNCFNGRLDEIRISNVIRHTASFTPPTSPYIDPGIENSLDWTDTDGNLKGLVDGEGNIVLDKTAGQGIKVDVATPTFGWRDLRAEIRTRGVGGTDPNDATYIGSVKAYNFSVNDEAWIEFHIPHDYVKGTDIHLHFHWSHNSALVTGGTITLGADVTYAKGHDQAAFAATVNPTLSPSASTTQFQHIISEVQLSAISPSATQIDTDDLEPDGLILARVYLAANNITFSGVVPDPFIHEVDVHYQSTNIATKEKVPDFYT